MLRRLPLLLSSSLALVAAAVPVLACPPAGARHGPSFAELFFPLLLLLGVPALVFRTVAPPLLPFQQTRKLWPLQAWASVLGAFLLATLSFREWRAWAGRVAEALRQKVMLESRLGVFRQAAKEAPWAFPRAAAMATLSAVLSVVAMWAWTGADPDVSWGEGAQVPLLFTVDTLLTFVAVRWLALRVGLHLAPLLLGPPRWTRGVAMTLRGALLGGAAGWLWGALFGVSSGVQTCLCMNHARLDVVPLLAGWYGIHSLLVGVVAGVAMAAFMAWPRRR